MADYRLADLRLHLEGAGSAVEEKMRDYRCRESGRADICVTVTAEMKQRERMLEGPGFPNDYLESIAVYRAFCEQALRFDVMFFHASALARNGEAFLFSGPSGSGKSTHTQMWEKAFGSEVIVINDDKPLIRFLEDGAYVYGTPWDGKAHLNRNIRLKISGIAMIRKSSINMIRRLNFQEACTLVRSQLFHPDSWEHREKNVQLGNCLLNRVPIYQMECTASTLAAEMAWKAMHRKMQSSR